MIWGKIINEIASLFRGCNWYDGVVPVVLLYGIRTGWEEDFTEKLLAVVETIFMLAVGIALYSYVSVRLQFITGMTAATARPTAFVLITILVRLLSLWAQHAGRHNLAKLRFWSYVELIGGPLAGFLWASALMIWLTLALSLTHCELWHNQITRDSRFGASVVARVPAVATAATRHLPRRSPLIRSSQIRDDLDPAGNDL